MLSAEAVGLAITIAKGLIKLTRRVDLVLAEKTAVQGPMGLGPPPMAEPPTDAQARLALKKLLAAEQDPPLGDLAVSEIQSAIDGDTEMLRPLMIEYLPEQAMGRVLDLDGAFVTALRERHPDLAEDRDLMMAAFHMSAGPDVRKKSYTWRIALTVADVVAEFGGENAALFTRDPGLQKVVGSVLARFGEADVQKTDSNSELLRTVLAATLNGALDARDALDGDNAWVSGVLDALATARDSLPEDEQSEFLIGLVRGKGYPALVAAALEVAAGRLNEDDARDFRDVAADVLVEVAGVVRTKRSFKGFFQDHWGDILRAGLESVERHGPALLADEDPLLSAVLMSVVGELARRPSNRQLSGDVLLGIVEAAASAVAANPALVADGVKEEWLRELINSVTSTISMEGVEFTFTRAGIETLLRGVLARFAVQPELIIDEPGLAREIVRGVLSAIMVADTFAAEELATTVVAAALDAVAANPQLLKLEYPSVVASLSGKVAVLVKEGGLSRVQGAGLLGVVAESLAENPALFLDLQKDLADGVIDAVVSVAGDDEIGLVAGTALVELTGEVLAGLARSGQAAIANHGASALVGQVGQVVAEGFALAGQELGSQFSRSAVPVLIGELVVAWALGDLTSVDATDDDFKRAFHQVIELL